MIMAKRDWIHLGCIVLLFFVFYFILRPTPPSHSTVEFTEDDVYRI